jgi:hypothetical protein
MSRRISGSPSAITQFRAIIRRQRGGNARALTHNPPPRRPQRGLRAAALGQERAEVAAPVLPQHHGFAVDQCPVHIETASRLGDRRETVSEVRAATAPNLDAFALLQGEDAEAVLLDLVQPPGSGGRAVDERGLARAEEAFWRICSPTGRRGAPGFSRGSTEGDRADGDTDHARVGNAITLAPSPSSHWAASRGVSNESFGVAFTRALALLQGPPSAPVSPSHQQGQ